MPIQAALQRVHLLSPQPEALARFYQAMYAMAPAQHASTWLCQAPGRELGVSPGPANQLAYALYRFATLAAFQQFAQRVVQLRCPLPSSFIPSLANAKSEPVCLTDPDGNTLLFVAPANLPANASSVTPPATLQHFALRTRQIDAMVAFYADTLGFVVSDRVHKPDGTLSAAFLRTDNLHHSLALFGAPHNGFDHQSYETGNWDDLKTWADRTGRQRTVIEWGIGRHGPGNDVFFMVRDPDGNLAEISAEIEVCPDDRPTGIWPHEEWTLNQWGKAIMRS